jgi:hypothetical protein
MAESKEKLSEIYNPEPRWLAWIVVLAVGGIITALPSHMIVGPRWAFLAVVILLLIPTMFTHYHRLDGINRVLGLVVNGVVTIAMVLSVGLLIDGLPEHREQPTELLLSAVALWGTNVLVFGLWYWRLDAGGPHGRDERTGHEEGAFLFPQMTLPNTAKVAKSPDDWKPNFIDYLFLAFNTSTAFSPTDVPVLARWAKVVMMVQSLISLTVLALLAARAVNIL